MKGVVTGLTEGARYHAETVWQHMGGGEKTELKPGEKIWQKADREDKAYMAVIMIMAMLMMGLAAAAGVWMSAATTMAITGFISVKGKGRKRRTARLVMMTMLTAVAAWVTVGSGGGDRNDGAIGGLVMPGMHPIGAQNETEYEARPGIVHTMTFVGHV